MDSLEPLPDTYSLQQGPIPISILPIELTMDSTEGAPRYVQNFLVRHMDDSRMELVNVETQEIFNLNLASLASNAVETAGSELNKSPSESDNGTLNNQRGENESVIQYSSSAQTTTTSSLENQKSDITSYLCFTCNDYFKSLSLYRRHVKCHRVEKEFTCQKCLMGFNVETNLKIHSITNHPTTTNICPFCKVSFTRQASLRSHILVHQVEELIICDKCDAEFLNDDDLLRHMESHALTKTKISAPVDDIACTQCELNFLSQSELSLHMAKHNEPKRHKYAKVRKGRNRWFMIGNCRCQYCGKDFPKEWLLDRHLRIHTGEKPFKCQLCGKGFTQKGSLRIHMDKHKGLKPYSCSHCSARFSQKGNLKAHIQKTHIVPNGGPHKIFRCSHCSCIFRKLATLNGHMTKAHLGYPEGAEEGHTEVSSNQLSIVKLAENHANGSVRRYTVRQKKIGDVRWYFCNYCSAKFKKPSDLIRHFRTHTLEKPFKCLVCGQAFSLKLTLKNHMKLHVRVPAPKVLKESGIELSQKEPLHASVSTTPKASQLDEEKVLEKPFQCKVCSAFFTGSLSLGKHMLLHNAGRQLKCSLCTKTFATKCGLKEHTNHHQNKKNHTCETCPKKFATASLLQRHSFVHSKVKPSTCRYCTKSFKTAAMCRTHIKTGHSLPSEGDAAEIAPLATEDEVLNKVPAEGESLGVEQVYEPLETDMPSVAPIPQAVPLDIAPEIPTLTGNSRDYQMVYLNFNDLPNATTMENSIINPSAKLQNIFNPITDVLFNTYPDVLVEKPIESATAHQQQETPPAVADVLPINVIDATALNEVPLDAQVYCINCHRMFSDCYSFERHVCLPDDSVVKLVLNDQQAGEEVNKSVCYENKNLKVSNSSEMDVSPMKRFSDKKSLIADIQKLEQPKQFRCDHCTYVTSVEERYRRHLLLHPSLSDRVCKFCCKFFRKPSDLKRHLRTHTGEKPYECECCRKKFALKSTLESHLRTHDVVGQAKISCDVCHANFTSRSSLKVHMLLHTGERPYSCKFCEQAFRTLSILKAHEKRHANRLSESANDLKEIAPVSQITPADAAQQEAMVIFNPLEWMPLDVLQQIEEGSGIVIAQEVGGDGTTASNVGQEAEMEESKSAKRTKDKQQKVECDICHKVYSSKDVLRKHKKALHGQNKKFPCIKCDKGYDQLEDLNKHIKKLHSGLRPYACQYCSNSFGEEHSLKTHIKRIHQKSLFAQETKNALRSLQLDLSSEEHNFF